MKPGSKVICIDDNFLPETLLTVPKLPRKGVTYTVRGIIPDPLGRYPCGITLVELVNPPAFTKCANGYILLEFGILAQRFVEVEKQKADDWDTSFELEEPLPLIYN